MQIPVISVGNSKGIRLHKMLLQKYNIGEVVELVMESDHIILRPVKKPREGWDDAFRAMHENGDDALLMPDVFEEENFDNSTSRPYPIRVPIVVTGAFLKVFGF